MPFTLPLLLDVYVILYRCAISVSNVLSFKKGFAAGDGGGGVSCNTIGKSYNLLMR